MAKLPAFLFYPGDWQKDLDLRRCSHAAKGVWMDMLCLMHESEQRGVLITGNCAWSEKDIAAAVGGNADVTLASIAELLSKGVLKKRQADGAYYCARMVREETKRLQTKERVNNYRKRNAHSNGECNGDVTAPPRVTPEGEDENEESLRLLGECEGGTPKALAVLVLAYLNEKAGRNYRQLPEYLKSIEARLDSVHYDVEGVKQMIDRQIALWRDDPVMDKNLNPKTLFRASNFPGYYDDRSRPVMRKQTTVSIPNLRAMIADKRKESDTLWRRHYSETQSLIGGEYHPPGWRNEDAGKKYYQLKKEIKALEEQLNQIAL